MSDEDFKEPVGHVSSAPNVIVLSVWFILPSRERPFKTSHEPLYRWNESTSEGNSLPDV